MTRRLTSSRTALRSVFAPLVVLLALVVGLAPSLSALACSGKVWGYKCEDLNGDGVCQDSEPRLNEWEISFKKSGSATTTTRYTGSDTYGWADGYFEFAYSSQGTYSLWETLQGGWYRSSPAAAEGYTWDISGDCQYPNTACRKDFANVRPGQLTVSKVWQVSGQALPAAPAGVVASICIIRNQDAGSAQAATLQPRNGAGIPISPRTADPYMGYYCQDVVDSATWQNLWPGTYDVVEMSVSQPGWAIDTTIGDVTVTSGLAATPVTIDNTALTGELSGYKFSDANGDGVRDAGEVGVADWTVTLLGTPLIGGSLSLSTTTDASGYYEFTSIPWGTYTVCEGAGPNTLEWAAYRQTAPNADQVAPDLVTDSNRCYVLTVGPLQLVGAQGVAVVTQAPSYDFGNQQLGGLIVTKTLDWNGAEPVDASFSICIQGPSFPDDPTTPAVGQCLPVSIAAADLTGTAEWTSLIPGDYTVTEDPGIVGSAWTPTLPAAPVTVYGGQTAGIEGEIEILNTYGRGSLTATKAVYWNGVTPVAASFSICIQGPSFTNDPAVDPLAGQCLVVEIAADATTGTAEWTDLIPGTYTVTETDPGADWIVAGDGVEVVVAANAAPASATITNSREALGGLDVTKTVVFEGVDDKDLTFEVCIEGPSFPNGSLDAGACQVIAYTAEPGPGTDGTATTVSWENLIPGQYTVTETDPMAYAGSAGYLWAVEVTYPNDALYADVVGPAAPDRGHADVLNSTSTATGVELKDWAAVGGVDSVNLSWTTLREEDVAEFRLYRSTGGEFAGAMMAARLAAQGSPSGGYEQAYGYVDGGLNAGTYNYWLVEVSGGGAEKVVAGPTAGVVGVSDQAGTVKVYVPLMLRH